MCYYGRLGLTDRSITQKVFGSYLTSGFDKCILKASSMDVTQISSSSSLIQDISPILNGFNLNKDTLGIEGETLRSLKLYRSEDLLKWQDLSKSDYGGEKLESENPELVVSRMNEIISCVNNEIQLTKSKCSKSPISGPDDTIQFRNSESYCIVPSFFNHDSIVGRYTTENTVCASYSSSLYSGLKTCVKEHTNLLENMVKSLDETITPVMGELIRELKIVESDISSVKSGLSKSIGYIESIPDGWDKNVKTLMNCSVMRQRSFDNLGNLCVSFMRNSSIQSIFMVILGPFMTIFSILACVNVLQTDLTVKRKEAIKIYEDKLKKKLGINNHEDLFKEIMGFGKLDTELNGLGKEGLKKMESKMGRNLTNGKLKKMIKSTHKMIDDKDGNFKLKNSKIVKEVKRKDSDSGFEERSSSGSGEEEDSSEEVE